MKSTYFQIFCLFSWISWSIAWMLKYSVSLLNVTTSECSRITNMCPIFKIFHFSKSSGCGIFKTCFWLFIRRLVVSVKVETQNCKIINHMKKQNFGWFFFRFEIYQTISKITNFQNSLENPHRVPWRCKTVHSKGFFHCLLVK